METFMFICSWSATAISLFSINVGQIAYSNAFTAFLWGLLNAALRDIGNHWMKYTVEEDEES